MDKLVTECGTETHVERDVTAVQGNVAALLQNNGDANAIGRCKQIKSATIAVGFACQQHHVHAYNHGRPCGP